MDSIEIPKAAEAIAKLQAVPDKLRNFAIRGERGVRQFGFDLQDMPQLIELGLANRMTGGESLFDWRDLASIASAVHRNAVRMKLMRRWLQLSASAQIEVKKARVSLTARPGPGGPVEILTPLGVQRRASDTPIHEIWQWQVQPLPVRCLPEDIYEFVMQYADVQHYFLPWQMEQDLHLFHRVRIADCRSATFAIYKAATEAGLAARPAWGLLVAAPFSTPHAWVEFLIDGDWVPVDIHLASSFLRWGLAEGPVIDIALKLGSLEWRMAERRTPFVRVGTGESTPTFATTILN